MEGDIHMEKIQPGEIFTLTDENDQDQDVEVLATLTHEGTEYLAVALVDQLTNEDQEEDIDVFFLKVEENGELSTIEDDDEFDKVTSMFDEMMDEEDEE